jgi:hypothetical protein
MLVYLFFWYVILILWARRLHPFNRQTWITRRFVQAQTSIILTLLVARHNLTHWTLRIRHLLQEKWMGVKILFKKEKENLLSMRLAELMTFQCSKVLDVDNDM